MSPRLSGQRAYRGEIVAPGEWEAILTPDETAQLTAVLSDPARTTRRTVRRYLLSGGLLRCSICQAPLVARPRGDGTRRYVCAKGPGLPGCGRIAILAEPIEALIAEAVLYRLDTPELAAALAGARAGRGRRPAHASLMRSDTARGACPGLRRAADHVSRVPRRPQADRGTDRGGAAQGQPPPRRARSPATSATAPPCARLGGPAANPSAGDRGGGPRSCRRPSRRPRPDPLRPGPDRARLAALTEQHDDRADRGSVRDLGRDALRCTGPVDPPSRRLAG